MTYNREAVGSYRSPKIELFACEAFAGWIAGAMKRRSNRGLRWLILSDISEIARVSGAAFRSSRWSDEMRRGMSKTANALRPILIECATLKPRSCVSAALKDPALKNNRDNVDIIIALGMVKEGFDCARLIDRQWQRIEVTAAMDPSTAALVRANRA